MNERERAVDNLITKARYAAGVYAVLPPESRKPHEHDLKVAVDHFLEVDALAAPGLRFGAELQPATGGEYRVRSACGAYRLKPAVADGYALTWVRGHRDSEPHKGHGNFNSREEALTALASAPPPPGVEPTAGSEDWKAKYEREDRDHDQTIAHRDAHEERINQIAYALGLTEDERAWSNLNDVGQRCLEKIAELRPVEPDLLAADDARAEAKRASAAKGADSILKDMAKRYGLPTDFIRSADDPQATPAAETVTPRNDAGTLKDRVLSHSVQREDGRHMPAGIRDREQFVYLVGETSDLASRVAEVERLGAAHERRRSDHEIWVADKIKTYEDDIAALRRDVEAMKQHLNDIEADDCKRLEGYDRAIEALANTIGRGDVLRNIFNMPTPATAIPDELLAKVRAGLHGASTLINEGRTHLAMDAIQQALSLLGDTP